MSLSLFYITLNGLSPYQLLLKKKKKNYHVSGVSLDPVISDTLGVAVAYADI